MPRAAGRDIKIDMKYSGPLQAPVQKGTQVGVLRIEIPGQSVIEVPLQAGADVARQGFFTRAKSRLSYLLTGTI